MLSYFYNVFFSFSFIYFSTVALAKIKCLRFFKNIYSSYCLCEESDVTYDQVWWPILGICALHLSHPKCTHTVNTHPEQWAAIYAAAPGEQPGSILNTSVVVLRMEESAVHSLPPPTIPCQLETQTRNLWITSPTL